MSSEKFSERFRMVVFALFLIALIIFGVVYRPADALSEPRNNATTDVIPHNSSIK